MLLEFFFLIYRTRVLYSHSGKLRRYTVRYNNTIFRHTKIIFHGFYLQISHPYDDRVIIILATLCFPPLF